MSSVSKDEINNALSVIRRVCNEYPCCDGCPLYDKDIGCNLRYYLPNEIPDVLYDNEI